MSGPSLPPKITPFDVALRHLEDRLIAAGISAAQIRPSPSGVLQMRLLVGASRMAMVLELASDVSPPDCSVALGRHRLATRQPLGGTRELRQRLLSTVRRVLLDVWRKDVGFWLAVPNHGVAEVPRSIQGLAALLDDKIPPGVVFWKNWHRPMSEGLSMGPGGEFILQFRNASRGHRIFLLTDVGPRSPKGRLVLNTPLGALWADDGESSSALPTCSRDCTEGRCDLDIAVGFLLARAMSPNIRWSAAIPEELSEKAGVEVGPNSLGQRSLEEFCLSTPAPVGSVVSRFFEPWGNLDSFGITALMGQEDVHVVFHATRDCAMHCSLVSRVYNNWTAPWDLEVDRGNPERNSLTDMTDSAALTGGEPRLAAALEAAVSTGTGPVHLFMGCEYHTLGDDPHGVVRCGSDQVNSRVKVMQDLLPMFQDVDARDWWRQFIAESMEQPRVLPSEPTVNLVGYGRFDSTVVQELTQVLKAAGVQVANAVLPFRGPGAVASFASAHLNVVSPWAPIHEIFASELERREIPFICPPLPYGLSETARWLAAIHDALGREVTFAAEDICRWTNVDPVALDRLREQLRQEKAHMVFVFDHGTLREFLSPRFFFGTDPLSIFEGSAADITVIQAPVASSPRPEVSIAKPEEEAIAGLARRGVSYRRFPANASLSEVLEGLDGATVYCDDALARPLPDHAVTWLSIRHLRPGPRATLANFNALLARTRLKLVRQQARLFRGIP